jgi:hypothetical protein
VTWAADHVEEVGGWSVWLAQYSKSNTQACQIAGVSFAACGAPAVGATAGTQSFIIQYSIRRASRQILTSLAASDVLVLIRRGGRPR